MKVLIEEPQEDSIRCKLVRVVDTYHDPAAGEPGLKLFCNEKPILFLSDNGTVALSQLQLTSLGFGLVDVYK